MNLVDSSGWLEVFAGGPNANDFVAPLRDTENLIVPTISLFEVSKRLLAQAGESEALDAFVVMTKGRVVGLSAELALAAASLSAELKLPMADSIILATARAHDATLWTQDADFEGLDGVRYFPKKQA